MNNKIKDIRSIIKQTKIYFKGENITKYKIIQDFNNKLLEAYFGHSSTNIFIHPNNKLFEIDALAILTLIEFTDHILDHINDVDNLTKGTGIYFRNEFQKFDSVNREDNEIILESKPKGQVPLTTIYQIKNDPFILTSYDYEGRITENIRQKFKNWNNFVKLIVPINANDDISVIDSVENRSIGLYLKQDKNSIKDLVSLIEIENSHNRISFKDLFSITRESGNNNPDELGFNKFSHEPLLRITNNQHQLKKISFSRLGSTHMTIILNQRENFNEVNGENEILDILNRKRLPKKFLISNNISGLKPLLDKIEEDSFSFFSYSETEINNLIENSKESIFNSEIIDSINKVENEIYIKEPEELKAIINYANIVDVNKEAAKEFNSIVGTLRNIFTSTIFPLESYSNVPIVSLNNFQKVQIDEVLDYLDSLSTEFDEDNRKQAKTIISNLEKSYQYYKTKSDKGNNLIEYLMDKSPENRNMAYILDVHGSQKNETIEKLNQALGNTNIEFIELRKFNPYKQYDEIVLSRVFNSKNKNYDFFLNSNTPKVTYILYESQKQYLENQRNYRFALDVYKTQENQTDSNSIIKESKIGLQNYINEDYLEENFIDEDEVIIKDTNVKSKTHRSYKNSNDRLFQANLEKGYVAYFNSNYKVKILDDKKGEIKEVNANKLKPGNKLLFFKEKYRKSIVDTIFKQLVKVEFLPADSVKIRDQALSWKFKLKNYYFNTGEDLNRLENRFKIKGSSVGKRTLRNWLTSEFLVSPKSKETIRDIGKVIGDKELEENYEEIFTAGKKFKHNRFKVYQVIDSILFEDNSGEILQDPKLVADLKNHITALKLRDMFEYDHPEKIENHKRNKPLKIRLRRK